MIEKIEKLCHQDEVPNIEEENPSHHGHYVQKNPVIDATHVIIKGHFSLASHSLSPSVSTNYNYSGFGRPQALPARFVWSLISQGRCSVSSAIT